MKNILRLSALLTVLISGLFLLSCKRDTPDESPEKPYMSVSGNKFTVGADGGIFYATASSNRKITASFKEEWCRVDILPDVEEDNLAITISANSGRERSMKITLSASECPDFEISVKQSGSEEPGGEESDKCDLVSFRIDGAANRLAGSVLFDIDNVALTATGKYLKWIDGDEPAMMIPSFTTDGKEASVNGTAVESDKTKLSFADNISLTVVAENGDTKTYTVSLICPQINTELPVLRLRPDSGINSKEVYVKTTLDMYSPATTAGRWSENDGQIEVRGRGNSTWGLPKKPYRLKFPEKFSPIGLNHAKEKSWVIIAHDMDKSLLRNHMAFELSRILFNHMEGYHDQGAIMFTPCSQFVNVYMGSDYHGVYQMSDHMQQGNGRIAVDKLTAADGSDWDKITGGHILEVNIHPENPPVRFRSGRGVQIDHKYPDDDDSVQAQYDYMEGFIRDMENILYGNNFKDRVNGWRKYLDEKTLADFIIVKEFAGDFDGYTSTYMYKRRGIDKIFFGPVWDLDKGWDNEKRNDYLDPNNNLMINAGFKMPGIGSPDWFQRLWQDEEFRKFVGARWAAKKGELIAAVIRVLDERPVQMAKSIEANFTVWQFYYQASTEAKMPARTYELEIERIRALTYSRAALLDRLFK